MKTDNSKKLRIQKIIALLITMAGLSLLIYMIIVEDEPGAIPLLVIVIGTAWYFIVRARI